MAIYDNKKYLNLQETVEWCKDQIQGFKNVEQIVLNYGIKVLGQVDSPNDIPEREYEYGDAYLVGTETPYDIYIFTRNNEDGTFINLGAFAVEGTKGETGERGEQGEQGIRGSRIFTGMGSPASQSFPNLVEGDMYIRGDQGYQGFLYTYTNGDWEATINVRGPQGPAGIGIPGPKGSKGEPGVQGIQGEPGQSFVIMGTITSTSQLPDPEEAPRNEAYILKGEPAKLYFITGTDTLQWSNVDIGTYGTTITEDSGSHKIDSIDIQDLIPDGMQIIGTDVIEDDTYGLIVTGNIEAGVKSEMKSTENAGAYTIPIKNSDTVKVDVANNKFTLNVDSDIVNKVSKALVHPNSAPTATKLVGIDTANSQTLIDTTDFIKKEGSGEQFISCSTSGGEVLGLNNRSTTASHTWLRFRNQGNNVGEFGVKNDDATPRYYNSKTGKGYNICLDDNTFTKRDAQNSMKLGDMIINFGNIGSYSSGSGLATINLTFKTAFTNSNYWIMAVPDGDTSDSPQSYDYTGMVKISNRTNTGCTLSVNFVAGNKRGVTYIAIGK